MRRYGKTTLLLELARTLLERAQRDETYPIPVVLNFSSWARKRAANQKHPPTLAAWLETELVDTYDVSRKLAQHWIADDRLLPLLDGPDEVPPDQRAACVAAISTFRKEREQEMLPLVVCSRIADYEMLDTRLRLRGAVQVQPLTQAQVDGYFAQLETDTTAIQRTYTRLWEEAAAQVQADDAQAQQAGAVLYRAWHPGQSIPEMLYSL